MSAGWKKTVSKTAWCRSLRSHTGPFTQARLWGWGWNGPRTPPAFSKSIQEYSWDCRAVPQSNRAAIPFKPTIPKLKNYPDAHIIELRAGKCPRCSEDGEITLGLLGEGLEMWNPEEEGSLAAVSCAFKGLWLQMGIKDQSFLHKIGCTWTHLMCSTNVVIMEGATKFTCVWTVHVLSRWQSRTDGQTAWGNWSLEERPPACPSAPSPKTSCCRRERSARVWISCM